MAVPNAKETRKLLHMCPVANTLRLDQRLKYLDSDGSYNGPIELGTTDTIVMDGGGTVVALKIGSLSSTVPGSGVELSASTTRAMEVHADDNNTARAVGTQGRAIFGRMMVYADGACEDWGIHGLSKMSAVAKTGNVSAGVVGAFESTGTCSTATGSGNTYCAGVMGRLGGGGTFTIGSGTYLCGVLAFYNTSTANAFTNSGTSGFHVATTDIASCGKWDFGLNIEGDSSIQGIRVGIFASSGATTGGIPFAATQDFYSDGQVSTVEAHGASSASLGSGYCAKVGRFRHIVNCTTCAHEAYGFMGQVVIKSTTMNHYAGGLIGTFEVQTACTINSGAIGTPFGHAAVIARMGWGTSALTCTTPICGFLAVTASGALASGSSYAYGITSTNSTNWTYALGLDAVDNLFYAASGTAYESGVKIGSMTGIGATASGLARVKVGSTYYYIPLLGAGEVAGE